MIHAMGPNSPQLYMQYNDLGFALTYAGRFAEAKTALDRARELAADLGAGPNALVDSSYAELDLWMGDGARALRDGERGVVLALEAEKETGPWFAWQYAERGRARAMQGDVSGAAEDCREALVSQEKTGISSDRTYAPDALTCLGEAEIALGRLPEAIQHLERSASLLHRDAPGALALARFALARALHASGQDTERALVLARTALDDLRPLRGRERSAAAVETWLAERAADRAVVRAPSLPARRSNRRR
jgi:tetratricopeptide (TPR) repeat protein